MAPPPSGEEAAGRRQWVAGPPNTLLNALAQAELTTSTVDACQNQNQRHDETQRRDTELSSQSGLEPEDEEESDVEMDEERLEPRSDDDDT